MVGENLRAKSNPLIVFVHVPKTAGSTVNHYLSNSSLIGQDHIQNWLDNPEEFGKKIQTLDWVSGHVDFQRLRSQICAKTARKLRFFTAIRSPLEQITSHYNWLIEIYHRGGNFYENHPPEIKKISERIRNADNSSPHEVITQITLARGLFLNQQSNIVIGGDTKDLSKAEILDRFRNYELVASDRHLPALLGKMIDVEVAEPSQENKSTYHFDTDVFRTSEVLSFLDQHHKSDKILYDLVMEQGGCIQDY